MNKKNVFFMAIITALFMGHMQGMMSPQATQFLRNHGISNARWAEVTPGGNSVIVLLDNDAILYSVNGPIIQQWNNVYGFEVRNNRILLAFYSSVKRGREGELVRNKGIVVDANTGQTIREISIDIPAFQSGTLAF